MYSKAHKIKKAMELEIQKQEYDAAKALANAYLINVSTTNSKFNNTLFVQDPCFGHLGIGMISCIVLESLHYKHRCEDLISMKNVSMDEDDISDIKGGKG